MLYGAARLYGGKRKLKHEQCAVILGAASNDLLYLLQGAGHTLWLALWAIVLGTVLGFLMGWLRSVSKIGNGLIMILVDVSRSVPLLIQLIVVNAALAAFRFPLSPFLCSALVLTLAHGLFLLGNLQRRIRGGTAKPAEGGTVSGHELPAGIRQRHRTYHAATHIRLMDRHCPGCPEGYLAGCGHRLHRAFTWIANHRYPNSGAAVGATDRRRLLLPVVLSHRSLGCQS